MGRREAPAPSLRSSSRAARPAKNTAAASAGRSSRKRNKSAGKGSPLKGLMIVLLLLVLLLGLVYGYIHSKLELMQRGDEIVSHEAPVVEEMTEEELAAEQAEAERLAADMASEIDELAEAEVVEATGEVMYDENVINIMLIGTDERRSEFSVNARGDSCMILSINKETGAMKLVSFERGMGMPILDGAYKGQYDWLTHTFRYGGAELQMREVRECFKVDVNYYVRVNFNTFIQGIDAIGGVDIELTGPEANYFVSKKGWSAHTGMNHLNGEHALDYARLRKIDSDWKRVQRQRTVIQAALDQVKELPVLEIDDMLNKVLPLVQTNIPDGLLAELLMTAPKLQGVKVEQLTIPVKGTYGGMTGMGGRSMYAVNFAKNSEILQNLLYGDGSLAASAAE